VANLKGKVAVVTGASRGIGNAIALRLAQDGAAVVVNYAKNAGPANELVQTIKAAGGTAAVVQADVGNPTQVRALFETADKNHGHVDIVVNNAGVWQMAALAEFTPGHFHQIFDTNVLGPLVVSSEALKHFPKSGGRIINISSVASRGGVPSGSVYGASKAAVDALTMNWAVELGPRRITVNTVSPGSTDTDMLAAGTPEFRKMLEEKTPLGRIGRPVDIVGIVAFLASDDAAWITGENIAASGGLRP
jgi:3-oxoacyl-[acyl-carrier protein] reductase